MPFLLENLPYEWFSGNRLDWPTWDSFKAAFNAQFGNINYQQKLDEQVAMRVQGIDQLASNYIICIQGWYRRFLRPRTL